MSSPHVDRLGAVASGACAAHCAASALVPGLLAALGLTALLTEETEWGLTLVAVAVAAVALVWGLRRHHSAVVAGTLGIGMLGLVWARLLEGSSQRFGAGLGIAAGLLLIGGHLLNLRASRRCSPS